MAKFFEKLNENHCDFIKNQKIYFVATAPNTGRVHLSPKGLDTFRIFDNNTVAYLDLTGSGNEAAAHLLENGRLTLLFCSFTGDPLILRLYGKGRVIRPDDAEWNTWFTPFTPIAGIRQIVALSIELVQTSCGDGVPLFDFCGERDSLINWAESKGADGLKEYRKKNNILSIDGLPTGER